MTDVFYPPLIEQLDTWTTADWYWMILKAPFAPDLGTQTWVADIAADEVTVPGYARVLMTGAAIDNTVPFPAYTMDNPYFGTPIGAETGTWLVLYKFGTDDNDSLLAAAWMIAWNFIPGAELEFSFVDFPETNVGLDTAIVTGLAGHVASIDRNPTDN